MSVFDMVMLMSGVVAFFIFVLPIVALTQMKFDEGNMVVDKESWHFKILRSGTNRYNAPPTLCSYFWNMVAAVIKFEMLFVFAGLVIVVMGVSLAQVGYLLCTNLFPSLVVESMWVRPFYMIPVALVIILCGFIVHKSLEWVESIKEERRMRKYREYREQRDNPQPPKQVSALTAFLKAKKQKICPMITYK
ncbi:MAG: hypothetical protein ACRCWQ_02745 [Bacilli bacterium]